MVHCWHSVCVVGSSCIISDQEARFIMAAKAAWRSALARESARRRLAYAKKARIMAQAGIAKQNQKRARKVIS